MVVGWCGVLWDRLLAILGRMRLDVFELMYRDSQSCEREMQA
jgi:hypothetical protein